MPDASSDIQAKLALLRASYVAQLPQKLEQITQSWQLLQSRPDGHETLVVLHRIAHSLTGSGATFGFDDISAAARLLERQLKELLEAGPASMPKILGPVGNAMQLLQRAMQNAGSIPLPGASAPAVLQVMAKLPRPEAERRVFIAEADRSFSADVALQLRHYGYTVQVFSRIADVEAAIALSAPVAVIVDLLLPDTDGAGACAAMHRAQTWRVPLIFISSNMDFESRLRAVRAGGVAYFAKPLDIAALIDRLDVLAEVRPAEEYRVLVVDDSEPVAKYHASLLEQAGMQVDICTDPAGIMQPLVELNPDLILMDVYMPGCSGFEIAAVLRQQDIYLGTPIVFLSSETDTSKHMTALGLGADDFLTKPIDPQRLVSIVSARVQRARMMRTLISHDSLTGLLNHASIKDALEREIAQSLRNHTALAFVLLDLDRFKSVNDTYGHQAGDRVLKSLARFLQLHLRKTDYAGRYGGEEFAMILPHTDAAAALALLDKLRSVFSEVVQHAGNASFTCTFSGGVAVYGEGQSLAGLIKAADLALYAAKAQGRNRIVLAD